jgi:hypothetical protein
VVANVGGRASRDLAAAMEEAARAPMPDFDIMNKLSGELTKEVEALRVAFEAYVTELANGASASAQSSISTIFGATLAEPNQKTAEISTAATTGMPDSTRPSLPMKQICPAFGSCPFWQTLVQGA